MIFRIILFFAGFFIISEGWHETNIAYKYREPVKLTCQQLVDATPKPSWVSVDDCVVYLGQYQVMKKEKSGVVTSMAVMLFPSNEKAEDEVTKTSVVLNIGDSAKRDAIADNLTKLNALMSDKNPAKNPERLDRYQKLFEKGPLVLKETSSNEDFNLLASKLNPQHTTYAYSSLDDKSSVIKGILMMLGGAALSAVIVWSFVKRKS